MDRNQLVHLKSLGVALGGYKVPGTGTLLGLGININVCLFLIADRYLMVFHLPVLHRPTSSRIANKDYKSHGVPALPILIS